MATLVLGGLRVVLSAVAVLLLVNYMLDGPGPNPDLLNLIGSIMLAVLWPILLLMAFVSTIAGLLLIVAGMGLFAVAPSVELSR